MPTGRIWVQPVPFAPDISFATSTGHIVCCRRRRENVLLSARRFDYREFTLQGIGGNTLKTKSMLNRSISVVLFAVAAVCSAAAAQTLPDAGTVPELQEVDGVDLDDLLARAATSARRYAEVIQDLTTEETTTILTYDDEGRVTERRVFASQLMVHRFTHSPGEMEYRHVLSVDGREAGDREMRLQALARKLANASSASEERELIERESRIFGLTPGNVRGMLSSSAQGISDDREGFDLAIAGRETIDGMDFILVDYRLIRPIRFSRRGFISGLISPFIDFPDLDRIHMRGRLWLEASSGELWRDEGGYFAEGRPGFSEDPQLVQFEYQYAPSSYGIFTPERFEFTPSFRIRSAREGDFSPIERSIQEFAPFERFDADVQLFLEEPIQ